MAPTVILIRHAEANYNLHDPPLTDLGYGPQCEQLSKHLRDELPLASQVELIVVSPLRRTLQTAEQALGWLIKKGVPVQLLSELQENSDSPCDTGTSIVIMKEEWPQFDWSTVDPAFPSKEGKYQFTVPALTQRGIETRKWLRNRPEKVIAVVSHSAFLRYAISHRAYANADFRVFEFGEGDEEIGSKLIEWELTEKRGGGLGKSQRGTFGFGWKSA